MWKRLLALLMAAALCLSFAACDEDDWEGEDWEDEGWLDWDDEEDDWDDMEILGDPDQTWSVYWYLCGSDLESEYGAATDDLVELMEVELPENIQVVIQTGGAWMWMNDTVDDSRTQRWLYDSQGLTLVDEGPVANMGDADTLASFLDFCETEYPADRTMAIIWNHGGGSVSGAAFDENFDYDALTLGEFRQAFDSVYDLDVQNPPLDIIGFDACLMATVDTAASFRGIANYLVASEEMEPGGGWDYTGWLQALADHPGMDGAQLGRVICDTYMDHCFWSLSAQEATLSVVDLTKIDLLLEAYEDMGREALTHALVDPSFYIDFSREAEYTENYGGNTRDQGYSNLVDLGDLADNCSDILPKSCEDVMEALDNCVVYQVNGLFRAFATGLSCYYSFNGDLEDYEGFRQQGYSEAFKALYSYGLGGDLTREDLDYIGSVGYEEETLPEVPHLPEEEAEYPVYLDDEDYACLELDQDTLNMLKGVYFELAYLDPEDDVMLMLGQDNDLTGDWDEGFFRDNFRGVWGALDGNLVYMEVYYEGEDYTSYSVPILLNGKEYSLRVVYSYEDEEYYILGARKGLEDTGMADKNLIQLKPGDEITTLLYAATISGDDDLELVPVDTFTVTGSTAFAEEDLGDGIFLLMFELVDARNQSVLSQAVQFTVEDGEFDVEILE